MSVPVDMMGDYLPPPAPDPSQTLPAGMPTARYPAGRPVAGPQVPGNQMLGTPTMAAATQAAPGQAVPGQPAGPAAPAATALSLDQRRKALEERFMTEAEQEPTAEEITSAYQQSQKEKMAAMDEYLAGQKQRMEMLDPRKIVRQAAPQYVDFAKQVSGPLQILTAIGGKAMGLSGLNMMGALTGMIEGTTQGNLDAYNRAYQTWKDNYEQQREEYNDLKAFVSQMEKYDEGNLQRKNLAAQQGLEMIGVKEQIAKQGLNGLTVLDRTQTQLQKARLDLEAKNFKMIEAGTKIRDKQLDNVEKQIDATNRLESVTDRLEEKWSAVEEAAQKDPELKSLIDSGAALNSKTISRLLPISQKVIADFNTAASAAVGPLLREVNQGLPASALRAVRVEYKEMEQIPTLDKGWNTAKSALESLRYRVEQSRSENIRKHNSILQNWERFRSPYSLEKIPESGYSTGSKTKGTGTPEDPIVLD